MTKYVRDKFYLDMLASKPKWGPIGQIVYLRTYSRWLQDQGRREHWGETVRRVADYSVSLDPTMTEEERVVEAEKLFETVYKMRAFPAGRTLWVGGTEHSKTHGQSQFNCSFANINSLDDLHDIVVLLMNGVGVGVGVRTEEVDKFASQGTLNLNKQVVIKDYEYIGEPGTGGAYHKSNGSTYYTIHDSREGWAEFVRDFLGELLFAQDTHTIYVNLDHIRPEGTPLKTFGGRASGPKAIIDFIDGILKISHGMTKINDIFLLDTANLLGRMVVAGGTRRCYPSGTIVKTTNGPIEIQNIKVGMRISTPKGEKRVTNVFNQGVQKTIAVNHAFGSFHCTPNHRVAVFTDINEWEFKEAQHLTTEDRLVWDFKPIPGTPQRLPTLEVMRTFDGSYVRNTGRATKPARYPDTICSVDGCGRGSATLNGPHGALCNTHYLRLKKYGDTLKFRGWGKDVNLPEYIDADLAWLVGYIHGNGHVMKVSDSKGRLSVSCPTNRLEIIEKVTNILSKLCSDSKITVGQGDGNWVNIMVSNARLVSWLHEYVKRPSEEITIPSFITMAEPEIRAAYLAGVFDSDGNIYKHNFVAVDTIYEGFAAGIAKLYMTLGIGASIKRRERKEEGWSDISRVSIVSSEFKDAAYAAMKPYASTKLQDTILNRKGANTLTFKPKQSMSAGVPSGRAKSNYGNMSPRAVLDYTDISLIAYPVPVVGITDGITAQTWDIEVEDIHQFTAEGFVTHNSALIALGDSESVDFENAKVGDWWKDYPWREQANNSKVFYSKPTKESIKEGFKKILQYGEPAFVNGIMAKSIRRDWAGLNPCFTGDMRLLTVDGWVTFKDAYEHGRPLKIVQDSRVTYEGEGEEKPEHWKIDPENTDLPVVTQASHVFLTKENADIVKLEFLDGTVLRCTPDHLIATTIGMVEAQHLEIKHDILTYSYANRSSVTKVLSITSDGKEDVYCIKENTRRTLIVEGIVARRCAEILLSDKGFCNLVTTNLKYFAEHGDDEQTLKDTVEIITRHNLRITNTTIHGVSPRWDIVQKRDRLLGVSFTGYGDHADMLGEDVSLSTLAKMRKWVREEANNYADKMGIPHPLLATTVKPEGTITLLYGASSGIHDAYAPYYIRRVRMSRTDALAVVLAKMGVPVEDAINAPQTVVFSFPVKTAAKQAASKKSAVEQLERYKNIMQTYVDHNASNTIYLDESEVDEVTDWLYDNWDSYVAVSFLAKFGQYEQAPMEEIDEETYNKLAAQMPDLSDLHARLAEVEYEMSAGDELEGCDTGSCPIR